MRSKTAHIVNGQYTKGWHVVLGILHLSYHSTITLPGHIIISTAVRTPLLKHINLTIVRGSNFAATIVVVVVVVAVIGRCFGRNIVG